MNSPTAFKLPVAPLPQQVNESNNHQALPEGFVDDAAIAALLDGPFQKISTRPRSMTPMSELALSSDANDFAGWAVRPASPFRVIAEQQERAMYFPPLVQEPGIGTPHRGSHRWWIAAAAGASSALIVSLLFISMGKSADSEISFFSKPVGALQSALGSLVP